MTQTQLSDEHDLCGRDLPNSMWFGICDVMQAHGLEVPAIEVIRACVAMIDATPVRQGGRLLPDGSVNRLDVIGVMDAPIPFTLAEVTR